eukprot:3714395-Rhodomonas_salina.1
MRLELIPSQPRASSPSLPPSAAHTPTILSTAHHLQQTLSRLCLARRLKETTAKERKRKEARDLEVGEHGCHVIAEGATGLLERLLLLSQPRRHPLLLPHTQNTRPPDLSIAIALEFSTAPTITTLPPDKFCVTQHHRHTRPQYKNRTTRSEARLGTILVPPRPTSEHSSVPGNAQHTAPHSAPLPLRLD